MAINNKIVSLITGGAGFIGSHIAEECLLLGHQVIIVDDLSGGFVANVPANVHFICGSINDPEFLKTIFETYQISYIYHLAAYAAEGLSHYIRRFNYQNNLIGSVNLINMAILHKVKCFIFTSSIAIYGGGEPCKSEKMEPRPEDPYGVAKYAVEMDLRSANQLFGLNYIIFRPHNVYGERQNIGDKYRNVIGIFINKILQNRHLPIFGDGNQTRAFTYVSDIAPIIASSINYENAYNEIFNIGTDNTCSINELVEILSDTFEVTPKVHFMQARQEVVHTYCDHTKFNSVFGAINKTTLNQGVKNMAEWAKSIGFRETKDFYSIELDDKLPDGW